MQPNHPKLHQYSKTPPQSGSTNTKRHCSQSRNHTRVCLHYMATYCIHKHYTTTHYTKQSTTNTALRIAIGCTLDITFNICITKQTLPQYTHLKLHKSNKKTPHPTHTPHSLTKHTAYKRRKLYSRNTPHASKYTNTSHLHTSNKT